MGEDVDWRCIDGRWFLFVWKKKKKKRLVLFLWFAANFGVKENLTRLQKKSLREIYFKESSFFPTWSRFIIFADTYREAKTSTSWKRTLDRQSNARDNLASEWYSFIVMIAENYSIRCKNIARTSPSYRSCVTRPSSFDSITRAVRNPRNKNQYRDRSPHLFVFEKRRII